MKINFEQKIMKLRLLFAFIALSLVSCSGDDDLGTTEPVLKNLKEINTYNQDESLVELNKFENNRMTERYLYHEGDTIIQDIYTYDSAGRMILRVVENSKMQNIIALEYDDEDRIIKSSEQLWPYYIIETLFDYGTQGEIIAMATTREYGEVTDVNEIIYYLNDEGYVTTIEGSDMNKTIAYQEGNVISRTTVYDSGGQFTETYVYDTETLVKGPLLANDFIRFGDNKANYEIYYDADYQPARNRYLVSKTTTGSTGNSTANNYVYTFDDDGYPIEILETGSYNSKDIITYQ